MLFFLFPLFREGRALCVFSPFPEEEEISGYIAHGVIIRVYTARHRTELIYVQEKESGFEGGKRNERKVDKKTEK